MGVIESKEGYNKPLSVCAKPYTPWVYTFDDDSIHITTSGGPFFHFLPAELEYVGEDSRLLCDWSHTGPCGNGAISFPVKVNRWRVRQGVDY